MPRTRPSTRSHSPVCMPARTSSPSAPTDDLIASPQRIALVAVLNVAKKPSPAQSTSRPSNPPKSSRTFAWCRSISPIHPRSPRSAANRVEPTMSVKSRVVRTRMPPDLRPRSSPRIAARRSSRPPVFVVTPSCAEVEPREGGMRRNAKDHAGLPRGHVRLRGSGYPVAGEAVGDGVGNTTVAIRPPLAGRARRRLDPPARSSSGPNAASASICCRPGPARAPATKGPGSPVDAVGGQPDGAVGSIPGRIGPAAGHEPLVELGDGGHRLVPLILGSDICRRHLFPAPSVRRGPDRRHRSPARGVGSDRDQSRSSGDHGHHLLVARAFERVALDPRPTSTGLHPYGGVLVVRSRCGSHHHQLVSEGRRGEHPLIARLDERRQRHPAPIRPIRRRPDRGIDALL